MSLKNVNQVVWLLPCLKSTLRVFYCLESSRMSPVLPPPTPGTFPQSPSWPLHLPTPARNTSSSGCTACSTLLRSQDNHPSSQRPFLSPHLMMPWPKESVSITPFLFIFSSWHMFEMLVCSFRYLSNVSLPLECKHLLARTCPSSPHCGP